MLSAEYATMFLTDKEIERLFQSAIDLGCQIYDIMEKIEGILENDPRNTSQVSH